MDGFKHGGILPAGVQVGPGSKAQAALEGRSQIGEDALAIFLAWVAISVKVKRPTSGLPRIVAEAP
ncbi:MAG: hypothetical protein WAQ97_01890 [bacterium]